MGFEFYRIMNKKLDPKHGVHRHIMLRDVWRPKCKELADTQARVVQLVNLCTEFTDNTGELVAGHETAFAVWLFMEEDTKMKA